MLKLIIQKILGESYKFYYVAEEIQFDKCVEKSIEQTNYNLNIRY